MEHPRGSTFCVEWKAGFDLKLLAGNLLNTAEDVGRYDFWWQTVHILADHVQKREQHDRRAGFHPKKSPSERRLVGRERAHTWWGVGGT